MNTTKNERKKLPEGWIQCQSKSNPDRWYYFNTKTGKSSWTDPQADVEIIKQKSKKTKKIPEKKKEEVQKKNLKRKSDGNEDDPTKKKTKETPSPQTCKRKPNETSPAVKYSSTSKRDDSARVNDPSIKESPNQSENSHKRSSFTNNISPIKRNAPCSSKDNSPNKIKSTPTKNLANTRLSNLRAQLNAEAIKSDENEKSPARRFKISPKTTQNERMRLDLKSPNLNESKCMNTSPSSDSISIPSPSQFFAANKIICSMKAQLPEEFCNKTKPKNTFADIEEGICNQTTEYPFTKHPGTPPQFSEANQLVSAINSKLCYKSPKDLQTLGSANKRLENLRARLSMETETNEENNSFLMNESVNERKSSNVAMEVEQSSEVKNIQMNIPSVSSTKNCDKNEDVVLVVDTNIFIHELDVIKNVLNSHIKGYSEQPNLLVPWKVINELDRLKDNNNGNGAICKRARHAMDYLYKSLPENSRIKGQSLRDANSHIYPCEIPDDEILNCCLQQSERGKSVILLSNDKNLCNKAMTNGVKCLALADLKPLLEHKPLLATDPDLYASVKRCETIMHNLLANILENEMRAKYNNLWQHVLFKAPPWSLADVLACLLKHWIAVFNEVFPRIEHLIMDLKNSLFSIENKGPKSLSLSEVSNFKDLCLEIAKKCQIIPEYMELAKITVERLMNKSTEGSEAPIIDTFEGLWTVYSSYCAKLATSLGITHNIEDKLSGSEPLHALTSKWSLFHTQIQSLIIAMRGMLSIDNTPEESLARLETVFKESLSLINMDSSPVTKENMKVFCNKCRNMLQEAYSKFLEISELLNICKDVIGN